MKISPFGADLFRADRQTDRQIRMTKVIVTLHNVVNAPKNRLMLYIDTVAV